jgi:phosphatidylserine/phosphatidylglycerophosphate/cardiolipin synthase-like enzyme
MPVQDPDNTGIHEVVSLVRYLNDVQVEQIITALSEEKISLSASTMFIQRFMHNSPAEARKIVTALGYWQNIGGTVITLMVALRSAQIAQKQAYADASTVRLVWTGPISTSTPTRSTMNTLQDLIDRAQQQIVIVGYTIANSAVSTLKRLAAAQERGVEVIFIENLMETYVPILQKHWPANRPLPLLYTRLADPADPQSALHAKLAIVDQQYLLVTSANLSYHGLLANIEVGVEVHGPVAVEAWEVFSRLIEVGVCTKVEVS